MRPFEFMMAQTIQSGSRIPKKELLSILPSDLEIEKMFLHFFLARSLPFPLLNRLHAWLDARVGFMLYITGRKLCRNSLPLENFFLTLTSILI